MKRLLLLLMFSFAFLIFSSSVFALSLADVWKAIYSFFVPTQNIPPGPPIIGGIIGETPSTTTTTPLGCNNVVTNGDFESGNFNNWYSNSPTMGVVSNPTKYVYSGTYSANTTGGSLQQQGIPLQNCGGYPSQLAFAVYLANNAIATVQFIAYPSSEIGTNGNPVNYWIYNPNTNSCSSQGNIICIPESQSEQWYYIVRNVQQDLVNASYSIGPYYSAYIALGAMGGGDYSVVSYYDNVQLSVVSSQAYITTDKLNYQYDESVNFKFSGFTPFDKVDVSVNYPGISLSGGFSSDSTGSGSGSHFLGRNLPSYSGSATLKATDQHGKTASKFLSLNLVTASSTTTTILPTCLTGTATASNPVNYGGIRVNAISGSNNQWAIISAGGGDIYEGGVRINVGDSHDFALMRITVRLISVQALQDGTVVGATIVVGPLGVVCPVTSCTYGTATATNSVNYGNYRFYAILGSANSWAKVIIKDSAENTVDTLIINQGDTKTSAVVNLDVKVTVVRALQDGTVIGADLAVGSVGTYCPLKCGDKVCQSWENSDTCCDDCGCTSGECLNSKLGEVTATSGIQLGNYVIYALRGSNNEWVEISVTEGGKQIEQMIIVQGQQKNINKAPLVVKVNLVKALQDGTVIGTNLIVSTSDGKGKCTISSSTCTDSDGGLNYYVKGTISGPGISPDTATDDCVWIGGVYTLVERYCLNGAGATLNYVCPNGCIDGACLKVKCKDYDNSPDYINNPPYNINPTNYPDLFTKSYGTGIYAGSSPDNSKIYGQEPDPLIPKPTTNDYSTYYDHCANDRQLNEAFCMADGRLGAYGVQCPNGCKDGACVSITTTTTPGCTNHAQCSQACTSLCPTNVYGCCYGCKIGQCNLNTGQCYCLDSPSYCSTPAYQVGSKCVITTTTTTIPSGCAWGISYQPASGATNGFISKGSKIQVVYKPVSTEYFGAGGLVASPNNIFGITFKGWNTNRFTYIQAIPVNGISVYSGSNLVYSNLNGLQVSSTIGNSLKMNNIQASKFYFLYDKISGDNYPLVVGYWDGVNGKIQFYSVYNVKMGAPGLRMTVTFDGQDTPYYVGYTPSVYGNPNSAISIGNINPSVTGGVIGNYVLKTSWTTSSPPQLKLGDVAAQSDARDIQVVTENTVYNIGLANNDVVDDTGLIIFNPSQYGSSDSVGLAIPDNTLKAVVHFGCVDGTCGYENQNVDLGTSMGGSKLQSIFPNNGIVTNVEYNHLQKGTFYWKSNAYNYHEQVDISNVRMRHDYGTTSIKGMEKMQVQPGNIIYEYVFDQDVNFGGSIANPQYTYPVKINLMGKEFTIVGAGSSSIKVLQGVMGTATASNSVDYGNYKFYATIGSANSMQIDAKDKGGNPVEAMLFTGIVSGTTATKSTTKTSPLLDVTITSFRTLNDGTVIGCDLVIGPTGTTTKEYDTVADIVSTGISNDCFTENPQVKCAKEGEYTSGAVSPEYQYGCCEGLKGFNTRPPEWVGGGLLCYDPNKGEPVCKAAGTKSEGWYYSKTGELLRYEICEAAQSTCQKECNGKGYNFGNCRNTCQVGEFGIGTNGCPQPMCKICIAGQSCPPCPSYTCCCTNKQTCPYECCENNPNYLDKSCTSSVSSCSCSCPVGGPCPPCECPPPVEYVCVDHKCTPKNAYKIKFYAGWNMFSIPVKMGYATTTATVVQVTEVFKTEATATTDSGGGGGVIAERICSEDSFASKIWHYSNGKYVEASSIETGEGYWVKMKYDCVVYVTGEPVTIGDFPGVNNDWNQIGSPTESVNFSTVVGDCKVLSGPWKYNTLTNQYEKVEYIKAGEGYWIRVESSCTLGPEVPPPPPIIGSILGKIFGSASSR
jgi:hypothetical protein